VIVVVVKQIEEWPQPWVEAGEKQNRVVEFCLGFMSNTIEWYCGNSHTLHELNNLQ
jgi:hypothetical protein